MKYGKKWYEAVTVVLGIVGAVPETEQYTSFFSGSFNKKFNGNIRKTVLRPDCLDYSVLEKINKHESIINRLNIENQKLQKRLSMLEKYLGIEYVEETKTEEFKGYRKIKKDKKKK